jgi:hypothetical protein
VEEGVVVRGSALSPGHGCESGVGLKEV